MSEITVGFSRSKLKFAPISWLIRLCEKTNFSHSYIKIKSESLDRELIYQANGSGVYFIGKQAFEELNESVIEFKFNISEEEKIRILRWAVDSSGKKYSKTQLLGVGIKRLFKFFGINIKNPFGNENKAYICTELVAEATKIFGSFQYEDLDSIGLNELLLEIKRVHSTLAARLPIRPQT